MALPPLQRKLFRDNGYGPLLKPEIIPFTSDLTSDESDVAASTAWVRSFYTSIATFPVGTRMLFQQSAAPTGWTKETGSGYNNIALRLTTGNVANKTDGKTFTACMATGRTTANKTQGGTIGNQTAGGTISKTKAGGTVGNHALTVAQLAKHRHEQWSGNYGNSGGAPAAGYGTTVKSSNTEYAGSGSNHDHGFTGSEHGHTFTGTAHNHTFTGSAHNHSIDLDINYIDCIVAKKA